MDRYWWKIHPFARVQKRSRHVAKMFPWSRARVFQPCVPDDPAVRGPRHHRGCVPGVLRVHARGLPDVPALGGRRVVQRNGASRRDGHAVRGAGVAASLAGSRRGRLRRRGVAGGRGGFLPAARDRRQGDEGLDAVATAVVRGGGERRSWGRDT